MTRDYDFEEVINRVASLTAERLSHFEQLHIVTPITTPDGPRYRHLDVRRVTLLCELTDDFEVNEDALVIIMSLLDQLHGAHNKLEQLAQAIDEETSETRRRVTERLRATGLAN
ncbi:MAG: hypothetical protein ACSHXD_20015 [Marinosulfonomonas sp.]